MTAWKEESSDILTVASDQRPTVRSQEDDTR